MDNNSSPSLSYTDEADRAYGAAGMTVAVVVCNAEDLLVAVDLDASEPAEMLELADSYYFAGQHAKSVAAAWQQTLSAYRASLVMAAGNVLARVIIGRHDRVTPSLRQALRRAVEPDGRETCQLDDDEIDALFARTFDYLERVFSHPGVGQVTDDFVDTLRRDRRLGHSDIIMALRALSRL